MDAQAAQQRYLIYSKGRYGDHAVVHLVEASTRTDALWRYIRTVLDPNIVRRPDDSLEDDGIVYAHPLAYIEAGFKRYGEWQMRLVHELTLEKPCIEAFCGEGEDGSADSV